VFKLFIFTAVLLASRPGLGLEDTRGKLMKVLAKAKTFPQVVKTEKSCSEQNNAWYAVVPICLDTFKLHKIW